MQRLDARLMKQQRHQAGLSVRAAALAIGVGHPQYQAWEAGRTVPSAAVLPRIAAALGCEVQDFYREESR